MPKSIVVCCDGTGSQIGRNLSNVLKLYRSLVKDEAQVVYYDPGVGTIGGASRWRRFADGVRRLFGLVTGFGLDDNVLDAYRFVATEYEDGDQLFLLGFSRGAHTVRVVAAMIHAIGLLRPEQLNLADYALAAYKKTPIDEGIDASLSAEIGAAIDAYGVSPDAAPSTDPDTGEEIGRYFGRIAGARRVRIDFVGVWDTVSSVLVPRGAFRLPRLERLAYTRRNPGVAAFRQASAIDEKRRMFRLDPWLMEQPFDPDGTDPDPLFQNVREVWFAGYHADIGGGLAETESAVAKYPLGWMVSEAATFGLRFDRDMAHHLVAAEPMPGQVLNPYTAPNPLGPIHNSMTFAWRILEWLPKRAKWLRWPHRHKLFGWYLPRSEPRLIPDGASLHWSAVHRHDHDPAYQPPNWPGHWVVEE